MKPNFYNTRLTLDVLDTLNLMGVRYRVPEKDKRYIIIQGEVFSHLADETPTNVLFTETKMMGHFSD